MTATTRSSSDVRQEEAAEAEAPAGERPALTQRLRSPYVSAVLAVLLVAVGSLAAWQWVRTERLRRADAVATAQTQAVSAARTAIVPVLSYDYRHLDADFGRALALTAQPFKGQYQQTTAKAVRDLATATKAQVSAEVASAGVVCTGKDRCRDPRNVTVLLFVNQATTSSRLDKPQVDQNRVEVRMTRQGGHWLLAEVRAL